MQKQQKRPQLSVVQSANPLLLHWPLAFFSGCTHGTVMNLKLHIVTITFFVFLGMAILVVSGQIRLGSPPESEAAPVKLPDGFIQIDSASWGLNCLHFAAQLPPFKPTENDPTPPITIRRDNVLRVISTLCNGEEVCSIPITAEVLGKDPVPSCTKELRLEYRCKDLELIRRVTFFSSQRKPAFLDCRDKPTQEAPAKPASASGM